LQSKCYARGGRGEPVKILHLEDGGTDATQPLQDAGEPIWASPKAANQQRPRVGTMKLKECAALAATSMFALSFVTGVFAHETRILPAKPGNIRLVVGFHIEPAFEDSFNAIDVILSTYDGVCPGSTANIGKPIDVGGTASAKDPDTVDLKVEALYLAKSVPPGGAPFVPMASKMAADNRFLTAERAVWYARNLQQLVPANPSRRWHSWRLRIPHPWNRPCGTEQRDLPGQPQSLYPRRANGRNRYFFCVRPGGQPSAGAFVRLRHANPAFPG
jgi:hypothetical protein